MLQISRPPHEKKININTYLIETNGKASSYLNSCDLYFKWYICILYSQA